MNYDQKGISLVITFLIMSVMLAIVLSISSMLANQIKSMGNADSAISALYAAETGLERALYVAKYCPSCDLNYEGSFDGREYAVTAKTENGVLSLISRGMYKDAWRSVEFKR